MNCNECEIKKRYYALLEILEAEANHIEKFKHDIDDTFKPQEDNHD